MGTSHFNHVKFSGIKTIIPESYIDIDDELQYFDNNSKKLARAKKMMGYGRRYISDDKTTVTDLAIEAAEQLLTEMQFNREEIDLLVFVNQSPDYLEPSDASIAHGKLGLKKNTAAFSINLGCSGYVYALWVVHSMISSGAVKKCLLLAGDVPTRKLEQSNRKVAPVFGDAASASILEYTDDDYPSTFIMGSDGNGWDKIVRPFGGVRLPYDKETVDLSVEDINGNCWLSSEGMMKGEDVFNFTMDVAPTLLKGLMQESSLSEAQIDLFAIHQANKQIVENIIDRAGIPKEKSPIDVFSKYANNSTNSVVTVLCDQDKEKKLGNVVLCTFGIGLSWGGAVMNISSLYNGGISTYKSPISKPSRMDLINYWIKYFKGE